MALLVGTDTYVTLAEAETYFSEQYDSSLWDSLADDTAKERVLRSATINLDLYCSWANDKTDSEQILEHPRNDETEVDKNIKRAEFEIVRSILNSGSQIEERESELSEMKADTVQLKWKGSNRRTSSVYNSLVVKLLKPFCLSSNGLIRV